MSTSGTDWPAAGCGPRIGGTAWCAKYDFFTTGAYGPHARVGDAWADIRLVVDASVREAMDTFLVGLIWEPSPTSNVLVGGAGVRGVGRTYAGRERESAVIII
ncbi:hypothetical protein ACFRCW_40675 [Streptomyces sp. NPDC056653]|uniref:hypothetical protein n=1 Tax=Streptomyces sp. NPDC056653 TaxID=3345894 RepID=UPI0036825F29